MSIRVLIVDDHTVFRESLRAVLHGRDGIDIVSDVSTGSAAITSTERHRPDVVLMDLRLPDRSGVEITKTLTQREDAPAVLVLSSFDDRASILAALSAGARGYLVKTAPLVDLVRGIHAVHAGQMLLDTAASAHLRSLDAADSDFTDTVPSLTPREQQILGLLAVGASTSQIAGSLRISDKTVRNYMSLLYTKIGASTRSEAVLIAHAAAGGSTPSRER